jgi:hypothetical protein
MSNWHLLAVNCLNGSIPSSKGFLEIYVDYVTNIIAFSLEEYVWFLYKRLV